MSSGHLRRETPGMLLVLLNVQKDTVRPRRTHRLPYRERKAVPSHLLHLKLQGHRSRRAVETLRAKGDQE